MPDLAKQLACLSRSGAQRRCAELGLPATGSGKHCRKQLLDYFQSVPREIVRPPATAVSLKLYRQALWILDHLPWNSLSPAASRGARRAIAVDNQSFSLGRTCGVWGVNHETIKKRYKDPIVRALLQVFWDTMREMASGFSYSTCHVNKNFNGVPHVDKNNVGLSWALSLGDFEGGELMCETDNPRVLECHTTRRRPVIFDGHRPHWVLPYEGTRYSVILYTSKHGGNLEEGQRDLARAQSPEP